VHQNPPRLPVARLWLYAWADNLTLVDDSPFLLARAGFDIEVSKQQRLGPVNPGDAQLSDEFPL